MSSIIKFFVAANDAVAAGVAASGPGADLESATYGNFDVWSSLEEWQGLLVNRESDGLTTGADPDVVSGDDAPLVLLVPADLSTALADADDETRSRVTERWIEMRAEDGEFIDQDLAHELVHEVAALSASAVRTNRSLYCWIC